MIKNILKIYPDETAYSYISRISAHSGYIWNRDFRKEVLKNKEEIVDYNFLNVYKDDFINMITKSISLEDLIVNHTLFKFYSLFLPSNKRVEALEYALENEKCFGRKLPVPAQKPETYLKYCPICVEEDRQKYGECYYHIKHNIPYVNVCHKHKCKLKNTKIKNFKSNMEMFMTLELVVDDLYIEYCKNELEIKITNYISDILDCEYRLENEVNISKYLRSFIGKRLLSHIVRDVNDYYKELDYKLTRERLILILENDSYNSFDIVHIAYYFKINSEDLCLRRVSDRSSLLDFNKRVVELHNRDYSNKEIADMLFVHHNTITRILRKEINNYSGAVSKKKRSDDYWNKLDVKYSNDFKKILSLIIDVKKERMNRKNVSIHLGLKDKQLRKLPMLRKCIVDYQTKNWRKTND